MKVSPLDVELIWHAPSVEWAVPVYRLTASKGIKTHIYNAYMYIMFISWYNIFCKPVHLTLFNKMITYIYIYIYIYIYTHTHMHAHTHERAYNTRTQHIHTHTPYTHTHTHTHKHTHTNTHTHQHTHTHTNEWNVLNICANILCSYKSQDDVDIWRIKWIKMTLAFLFFYM